MTQGILRLFIKITVTIRLDGCLRGSGIPPCINMIYTKHYKSRYTELELWEKGTPDGEMCGGSALTKYELEEMKKEMSITEITNKSN